VGAGAGTVGPAAGRGAAVSRETANAMTSFFVIRPPVPVPITCERSTPFSSARRRTRGEMIWLLGPRSIGAAEGAGAAGIGVEAAGARAGAGGAGTEPGPAPRC
jgi:hypothetical protein